MKESVSGFKVQDNWNGVVDHGKKISNALKNEGVDKETLQDFEEWRPKQNETIEDISEKTVKKASIEKNEIEKEERLNGEVEKTKQKLIESVDSIKENETDEAKNKLVDSLNHVSRTFKTISRKSIRKSEKYVYKLMTKFTPYYFDNKVVSAELNDTRNQYTFEININDDNLKNKIQNKL